jgi:hypothetical protein
MAEEITRSTSQGHWRELLNLRLFTLPTYYWYKVGKPTQPLDEMFPKEKKVKFILINS